MKCRKPRRDAKPSGAGSEKCAAVGAGGPRGVQGLPGLRGGRGLRASLLIVVGAPASRGPGGPGASAPPLGPGHPPGRGLGGRGPPSRDLQGARLCRRALRAPEGGRGARQEGGEGPARVRSARTSKPPAAPPRDARARPPGPRRPRVERDPGGDPPPASPCRAPREASRSGGRGNFLPNGRRREAVARGARGAGRAAGTGDGRAAPTCPRRVPWLREPRALSVKRSGELTRTLAPGEEPFPPVPPAPAGLPGRRRPGPRVPKRSVRSSGGTDGASKAPGPRGTRSQGGSWTLNCGALPWASRPQVAPQGPVGDLRSHSFFIKKKKICLFRTAGCRVDK